MGATLELKDNCNGSITQTALLNVNSLTVASAGYVFSYGDGQTSINPEITSLSSPAQVGQNGPGIYPTASGVIQSYSMKIEKMNQVNGTVISTVCNYSAPTAVTNNVLAPTGQYAVANGAYDQSGNLLFYVRDQGIYNASGALIQNMVSYYNPNVSSCLGAVNWNIPMKEIAIVPKQGTCKQFYVIWMGAAFCTSGVALRYVTVNCEVSPATVTENNNNVTNLDFLPGNVNAGLAVSKKYDGTNRILYAITNSGYQFYYITPSGIVASGTFKSFNGLTNIPTGIYPTEVELSPDQGRISWASSESNKVMTALINISDKSITLSSAAANPISGMYGVKGIEFDASNNLYANAFLNSTSGAFYKFPVFGNTYNPPVAQITDATIVNSQLELAFDGKIYTVNNSGKLVAINIATNPVSSALAYNGITLVSNGTAGGGSPQVLFSLPDQIDGEDYYTFRGVAPLVYPSPTVRSNGVIINPQNSTYTVSNCNTFTLQSFTSNYSYYNLSINASNSSGNTGALLHTSGNVAAAYPDNQDLSILGSTNMRNTPNYYLVKLVFGHACDNSQVQYFLVNSQNQFSYSALGVNNTSNVALANGNYKVFTCNPITLSPVAPNHTMYKLKLESSNASGQVITGAGTLSYAPLSFTTGTFPSLTDLRTWPGTNSYINSITSEYILATLELKDNCNGSITQTALLNVNSLTVASAGYVFSYGDGQTSINPEITSLSSPAQVGQNGPGIYPTASGVIQSYSMKIEKMNQANGTVISTVCNYPAPTAVTNNVLPFLIYFNNYVANKCGGGNSYFANSANTNQVYKAYFIVNNACGSSAAKIGYFQNSDPSARKGDAGEAANSDESNSAQTSIVPNPSNGKMTLNYTLKSKGVINMWISDSQGNKILMPLENVFLNSGTYEQQIDLSTYPDGIYFYRLDTEVPIMGKIIKGSE